MRHDRSVCAVLTSGRLACYGGDGAPALTPRVEDARDVLAVDRSWCVHRRSGSVECWSDTSAAAPLRVTTTNGRVRATFFSLCAIGGAGPPRCVDPAGGHILGRPLDELLTFVR